MHNSDTETRSRHEDVALPVGTGMRGEVVAAGELLTTLVAFEGLVVGVDGPVVAPEMFLAMEAART